MPIGLKYLTKWASEGAYVSSGWTRNADGSLTSTGASTILLPCPVAAGRVFGADLIGACAGATVKWKRADVVTLPAVLEEIDDATIISHVPWPVTFAKPGSFGVGGLTAIGQDNASALWAGGYRRGGASGRLFLEVVASGVGDIIDRVFWRVAG